MVIETVASVRLKRVLNYAGFCLSILSIIFVVVKLREYGGQIELSKINALLERR